MSLKDRYSKDKLAFCQKTVDCDAGDLCIHGTCIQTIIEITDGVTEEWLSDTTNHCKEHVGCQPGNYCLSYEGNRDQQYCFAYQNINCSSDPNFGNPCPIEYSCVPDVTSYIPEQTGIGEVAPYDPVDSEHQLPEEWELSDRIRKICVFNNSAECYNNSHCGNGEICKNSHCVTTPNKYDNLSNANISYDYYSTIESQNVNAPTVFNNQPYSTYGIQSNYHPEIEKLMTGGTDGNSGLGFSCRELGYRSDTNNVKKSLFKKDFVDVTDLTYISRVHNTMTGYVLDDESPLEPPTWELDPNGEFYEPWQNLHQYEHLSKCMYGETAELISENLTSNSEMIIKIMNTCSDCSFNNYYDWFCYRPENMMNGLCDLAFSDNVDERVPIENWLRSDVSMCSRIATETTFSDHRRTVEEMKYGCSNPLYVNHDMDCRKPLSDLYSPLVCNIGVESQVRLSDVMKLLSPGNSVDGTFDYTYCEQWGFGSNCSEALSEGNYYGVITYGFHPFLYEQNNRDFLPLDDSTWMSEEILTEFQNTLTDFYGELSATTSEYELGAPCTFGGGPRSDRILEFLISIYINKQLFESYNIDAGEHEFDVPLPASDVELFPFESEIYGNWSTLGDMGPSDVYSPSFYMPNDCGEVLNAEVNLFYCGQNNSFNVDCEKTNERAEELGIEYRYTCRQVPLDSYGHETGDCPDVNVCVRDIGVFVDNPTLDLEYVVLSTYESECDGCEDGTDSCCLGSDDELEPFPHDWYQEYNQTFGMLDGPITNSDYSVVNLSLYKCPSGQEENCNFDIEGNPDLREGSAWINMGHTGPHMSDIDGEDYAHHYPNPYEIPIMGVTDKFDNIRGLMPRYKHTPLLPVRVDGDNYLPDVNWYYWNYPGYRCSEDTWPWFPSGRTPACLSYENNGIGNVLSSFCYNPNNPDPNNEEYCDAFGNIINSHPDYGCTVSDNDGLLTGTCQYNKLDRLTNYQNSWGIEQPVVENMNTITNNPPLLYQEVRVSDLLETLDGQDNGGYYDYCDFISLNKGPKVCFNPLCTDVNGEYVGDEECGFECKTCGEYLLTQDETCMTYTACGGQLQSSYCFDATNQWENVLSSGQNDLHDLWDGDNQELYDMFCIHSPFYDPFGYAKIYRNDALDYNLFEYDKQSQYPMLNENSNLVYNFPDGVKVVETGEQESERLFIKVYDPFSQIKYSAGCLDLNSGGVHGTMANPKMIWYYEDETYHAGCLDTQSGNLDCNANTWCNWQNSEDVCKSNGWIDNGDGTWNDRYGITRTDSTGCCCQYPEPCGVQGGYYIWFSDDDDSDYVPCEGTSDVYRCHPSIACHEAPSNCQDGTCYEDEVCGSCYGQFGYPCRVPPPEPDSIEIEVSDDPFWGIRTNYDEILQDYMTGGAGGGLYGIPKYKVFHCNGVPHMICGLHKDLELPIDEGGNYRSDEYCPNVSCEEITYVEYVVSNNQPEKVCILDGVPCTSDDDGGNSTCGACAEGDEDAWYCHNSSQTQYCIMNMNYPHPPLNVTLDSNFIDMSNPGIIYGDDIYNNLIYPYYIWATFVDASQYLAPYGDDDIEENVIVGEILIAGQGVVSDEVCDCAQGNEVDDCGNCGIGAKISYCPENNPSCEHEDGTLEHKGGKVCSETYTFCTTDSDCSDSETDVCNYRAFCNFEGTELVDSHFLDCACRCVMGGTTPANIDTCGFCELGPDNDLYGGPILCYPDYDGDGVGAAFINGTGRCKHDAVDETSGCNDLIDNVSFEPVHIYDEDVCNQYYPGCWEHPRCQLPLSVCPTSSWIERECSQYPSEGFSYVGEASGGGCVIEQFEGNNVPCTGPDDNTSCSAGNQCILYDSNYFCVSVTGDPLEHCLDSALNHVDGCGICNYESTEDSIYKDCNGVCFGSAVIDDCGICGGPCTDFENQACNGDYWPEAGPTCGGYRSSLNNTDDELSLQFPGEPDRYDSGADCKGIPNGPNYWDDYVSISCDFDNSTPCVNFSVDTDGFGMVYNPVDCRCTYGELMEHCCTAGEMDVCGVCNGIGRTPFWTESSDNDFIPRGNPNYYCKPQSGDNIYYTLGHVLHVTGEGFYLDKCCNPYQGVGTIVSQSDYNFYQSVVDFGQEVSFDLPIEYQSFVVFINDIIMPCISQEGEDYIINDNTGCGLIKIPSFTCDTNALITNNNLQQCDIDDDCDVSNGWYCADWEESETDPAGSYCTTAEYCAADEDPECTTGVRDTCNQCCNPTLPKNEANCNPANDSIDYACECENFGCVDCGNKPIRHYYDVSANNDVGFYINNEDAGFYEYEQVVWFCLNNDSNFYSESEPSAEWKLSSTDYIAGERSFCVHSFGWDGLPDNHFCSLYGINSEGESLCTDENQLIDWIRGANPVPCDGVDNYCETIPGTTPTDSGTKYAIHVCCSEPDAADCNESTIGFGCMLDEYEVCNDEYPYCVKKPFHLDPAVADSTTFFPESESGCIYFDFIYPREDSLIYEHNLSVLDFDIIINTNISDGGYCSNTTYNYLTQSPEIFYDNQSDCISGGYTWIKHNNAYLTEDDDFPFNLFPNPSINYTGYEGELGYNLAFILYDNNNDVIGVTEKNYQNFEGRGLFPISEINGYDSIVAGGNYTIELVFPAGSVDMDTGSIEDNYLSKKSVQFNVVNMPNGCGLKEDPNIPGRKSCNYNSNVPIVGQCVFADRYVEDLDGDGVGCLPAEWYCEEVNWQGHYNVDELPSVVPLSLPHCFDSVLNVTVIDDNGNIIQCQDEEGEEIFDCSSLNENFTCRDNNFWIPYNEDNIESQAECQCPSNSFDDCGICRYTECVEDILNTNGFYYDYLLWWNTNAIDYCSEQGLDGQYPGNLLWNSTCTGCTDTLALNTGWNCTSIDTMPYVCSEAHWIPCNPGDPESCSHDGGSYGDCIITPECCNNNYYSETNECLDDEGAIAWPTSGGSGEICDDDSPCPPGFVCISNQCMQLSCNRCKRTCVGQGAPPTCSHDSNISCAPSDTGGVTPNSYCRTFDENSVCRNQCPGSCRVNGSDVNTGYQVQCWTDSDCIFDNTNCDEEINWGLPELYTGSTNIQFTDIPSDEHWMYPFYDSSWYLGFRDPTPDEANLKTFEFGNRKSADNDIFLVTTGTSNERIAIQPGKLINDELYKFSFKIKYHDLESFRNNLFDIEPSGCPAPFCKRFGDADGNGILDSTDVNMIAQMGINLIDTPEPGTIDYYAADMTGDGFITGTDAVSLNNYLHGANASSTCVTPGSMCDELNLFPGDCFCMAEDGTFGDIELLSDMLSDYEDESGASTRAPIRLYARFGYTNNGHIFGNPQVVFGDDADFTYGEVPHTAMLYNITTNTLDVDHNTYVDNNHPGFEIPEVSIDSDGDFWNVSIYYKPQHVLRDGDNNIVQILDNVEYDNETLNIENSNGYELSIVPRWGETISDELQVIEIKDVSLHRMTECEPLQYGTCEYDEPGNPSGNQGPNCCCNYEKGCAFAGLTSNGKEYIPPNYNPYLSRDCIGDLISDCMFGFVDGQPTNMSTSDLLDMQYAFVDNPNEYKVFVNARSINNCNFGVRKGNYVRMGEIDTVYKVTRFENDTGVEVDFPYDFNDYQNGEDCPTFAIVLEDGFFNTNPDTQEDLQLVTGLEVFLENKSLCDNNCCIDIEVPACTVGPLNPEVTGNYDQYDIGYAALNYFCWEPGNPAPDGTLSSNLQFLDRCSRYDSGYYWQLPEPGSGINVNSCNYYNSSDMCSQNGWNDSNSYGPGETTQFDIYQSETDNSGFINNPTIKEACGEYPGFDQCNFVDLDYSQEDGVGCFSGSRIYPDIPSLNQWCINQGYSGVDIETISPASIVDGGEPTYGHSESYYGHLKLAGDANGGTWRCEPEDRLINYRARCIRKESENCCCNYYTGCEQWRTYNKPSFSVTSFDGSQIDASGFPLDTEDPFKIPLHAFLQGYGSNGRIKYYDWETNEFEYHSSSSHLVDVTDITGEHGIGLNALKWARSGWGMINGNMFNDFYDDCGECFGERVISNVRNASNTGCGCGNPAPTLWYSDQDGDYYGCPDSEDYMQAKRIPDVFYNNVSSIFKNSGIILNSEQLPETIGDGDNLSGYCGQFVDYTIEGLATYNITLPLKKCRDALNNFYCELNEECIGADYNWRFCSSRPAFCADGVTACTGDSTCVGMNGDVGRYYCSNDPSTTVDSCDECSTGSCLSNPAYDTCNFHVCQEGFFNNSDLLDYNWNYTYDSDLGSNNNFYDLWNVYWPDLNMNNILFGGECINNECNNINRSCNENLSGSIADASCTASAICAFRHPRDGGEYVPMIEVVGGHRMVECFAPETQIGHDFCNQHFQEYLVSGGFSDSGWPNADDVKCIGAGFISTPHQCWPEGFYVDGDGDSIYGPAFVQIGDETYPNQTLSNNFKFSCPEEDGCWLGWEESAAACSCEYNNYWCDGDCSPGDSIWCFDTYSGNNNYCGLDSCGDCGPGGGGSYYYQLSSSEWYPCSGDIGITSGQNGAGDPHPQCLDEHMLGDDGGSSWHRAPSPTNIFTKYCNTYMNGGNSRMDCNCTCSNDSSLPNPYIDGAKWGGNAFVDDANVCVGGTTGISGNDPRMQSNDSLGNTLYFPYNNSMDMCQLITDRILCKEENIDEVTGKCLAPCIDSDGTVRPENCNPAQMPVHTVDHEDLQGVDVRWKFPVCVRLESTVDGQPHRKIIKRNDNGTCPDGTTEHEVTYWDEAWHHPYASDGALYGGYNYNCKCMPDRSDFRVEDPFSWGSGDGVSSYFLTGDYGTYLDQKWLSAGYPNNTSLHDGDFLTGLPQQDNDPFGQWRVIPISQMRKNICLSNFEAMIEELLDTPDPNDEAVVFATILNVCAGGNEEDGSVEYQCGNPADENYGGTMLIPNKFGTGSSSFTYCEICAPTADLNCNEGIDWGENSSNPEYTSGNEYCESKLTSEGVLWNPRTYIPYATFRFNRPISTHDYNGPDLSRTIPENYMSQTLGPWYDCEDYNDGMGTLSRKGDINFHPSDQMKFGDYRTELFNGVQVDWWDGIQTTSGNDYIEKVTNSEMTGRIWAAGGYQMYDRYDLDPTGIWGATTDHPYGVGSRNMIIKNYIDEDNNSLDFPYPDNIGAHSNDRSADWSNGPETFGQLKIGEECFTIDPDGFEDSGDEYEVCYSLADWESGTIPIYYKLKTPAPMMWYCPPQAWQSSDRGWGNSEVPGLIGGCGIGSHPGYCGTGAKCGEIGETTCGDDLYFNYGHLIYQVCPSDISNNAGWDGYWPYGYRNFSYHRPCKYYTHSDFRGGLDFCIHYNDVINGGCSGNDYDVNWMTHDYFVYQGSTMLNAWINSERGGYSPGAPSQSGCPESCENNEGRYDGNQCGVCDFGALGCAQSSTPSLEGTPIWTGIFPSKDDCESSGKNPCHPRTWSFDGGEDYKNYEYFGVKRGECTPVAGRSINSNGAMTHEGGWGDGIGSDFEATLLEEISISLSNLSLIGYEITGWEGGILGSSGLSNDDVDIVNRHYMCIGDESSDLFGVDTGGSVTQTYYNMHDNWGAFEGMNLAGQQLFKEWAAENYPEWDEIKVWQEWQTGTTLGWRNISNSTEHTWFFDEFIPYMQQFGDYPTESFGHGISCTTDQLGQLCDNGRTHCVQVSSDRVLGSFASLVWDGHIPVAISEWIGGADPFWNMIPATPNSGWDGTVSGWTTLPFMLTQLVAGSMVGSMYDAIYYYDAYSGMQGSLYTSPIWHTGYNTGESFITFNLRNAIDSAQNVVVPDENGWTHLVDLKIARPTLPGSSTCVGWPAYPYLEGLSNNYNTDQLSCGCTNWYTNDPAPDWCVGCSDIMDTMGRVASNWDEGTLINNGQCLYEPLPSWSPSMTGLYGFKTWSNNFGEIMTPVTLTDESGQGAGNFSWKVNYYQWNDYLKHSIDAEISGFDWALMSYDEDQNGWYIHYSPTHVVHTSWDSIKSSTHGTNFKIEDIIDFMGDGSYTDTSEEHFTVYMETFIYISEDAPSTYTVSGEFNADNSGALYIKKIASGDFSQSYDVMEEYGDLVVSGLSYSTNYPWEYTFDRDTWYQIRVIYNQDGGGDRMRLGWDITSDPYVTNGGSSADTQVFGIHWYADIYEETNSLEEKCSSGGETFSYAVEQGYIDSIYNTHGDEINPYCDTPSADIKYKWGYFISYGGVHEKSSVIDGTLADTWYTGMMGGDPPNDCFPEDEKIVYKDGSYYCAPDPLDHSQIKLPYHNLDFYDGGGSIRTEWNENVTDVSYWLNSNWATDGWYPSFYTTERHTDQCGNTILNLGDYFVISTRYQAGTCKPLKGLHDRITFHPGGEYSSVNSSSVNLDLLTSRYNSNHQEDYESRMRLTIGLVLVPEIPAYGPTGEIEYNINNPMYFTFKMGHTVQCGVHGGSDIIYHYNCAGHNGYGSSYTLYYNKGENVEMYAGSNINNSTGIKEFSDCHISSGHNSGTMHTWAKDAPNNMGGYNWSGCRFNYGGGWDGIYDGQTPLIEHAPVLFGLPDGDWTQGMDIYNISLYEFNNYRNDYVPGMLYQGSDRANAEGILSRTLRYNESWPNNYDEKPNPGNYEYSSDEEYPVPGG